MKLLSNTSNHRRGTTAFTLVEIAIAIGIIGFALVAIIGILPAGLQVQRDNKEDTIMNQEGIYLLEAIRNGAEELVNLHERTERIVIENVDGSGMPVEFTNPNNWPADPNFNAPREVIGLLSTPAEEGPDPTKPQQVRAIIYAGSGAVADAATDLAFKYQVTIRNFEFTNSSPGYSSILRQELAKQLREVRLEFRWPILPNGSVGNGRHVVRTFVGQRLAQAAPTNEITVPLYFFQLR